MQVSFLIPAKDASDSIVATTHAVHAHLSSLFPKPGSFEIIIVPTVGPGLVDATHEIAQKIAQSLSQVRVAPHRGSVGKGAALKTGFLASHPESQWIWFTDADLPYHLDFFTQALALQKAGVELVTANRRLPQSTFDIPVALLSLAYRRHRLGLWFNRLARAVLPIPTTDTQAGAKTMHRSLAQVFFERQKCEGFFFDLELFLVAHAERAPWRELSVTLMLRSEKSTVRVFRQGVQALKWLGLLTARTLRGSYGQRETSPLRLFRRVKPLSILERVFLSLRFRLTPYREMIEHFERPADASLHVVDFGCGHGLFSILVALSSPFRRVTGLDHDGRRLELARSATGLERRLQEQVQFVQGSLNLLADQPSTPADVITAIDVLHYFSPEQQKDFLRNAYLTLQPQKGSLLFREIDPEGGLVAWFNRNYERFATASGFTRSERKTTHSIRTRLDWEHLLREAGFDSVTSVRCSAPIFSDRLYIARIENSAEVAP